MSEYVFSGEGPECPYCGRQYTADDPHYFDESKYKDEICDACNRRFGVNVVVATCWECFGIEDDEAPALTSAQSTGDAK